MQDIIVELVGQYGLSGLAMAAGVVFLTWVSTKKISSGSKETKRSIDELADTIIEQNSKMSSNITETLVSALHDMSINTQNNMVEVISKAIDTANKRAYIEHAEKMEKRNDASEEIYDIIKEITDKSGAARTILFEFHNSAENFDGLPFVKYDAVLEHPARDERPVQDRIRDFQLQILMPAIKPLYMRETAYVHYNSDFIHDKLYDMSAVLYSHYKELRIDDVIYIGCYSAKNRMIACIAVEFNGRHKFELEETDINDIVNNVDKISALLRVK